MMDAWLVPAHHDDGTHESAGTLDHGVAEDDGPQVPAS